MPPSSADRTLRRLIARLAEAKPEDREAVLSELSSGQQQEVLRLLDGYQGVEESSPPPTPAAHGWEARGLSAAMIARLENSASPGMRIPAFPEADSSEILPDLAPKALETLRRCAAQLAVAGPFGASQPAVGPGLFERLRQRRLFG